MSPFTRIIVPYFNANVQIRRGIEMYSSRFLREDVAGWVITAPVYRGNVVELFPGQRVSMWAPTANGLRRYETSVLAGSDEKTLLAKPKRGKRVERRQSRRITAFSNPAAKIEGKAAILLDVSSYGAQVFSKTAPRKGERVKLEMTHSSCFAWVLESRGGLKGSILRLRFEEPVAVSKF